MNMFFSGSKEWVTQDAIFPHLGFCVEMQVVLWLIRSPLPNLSFSVSKRWIELWTQKRVLWYIIAVPCLSDHLAKQFNILQSAVVGMKRCWKLKHLKLFLHTSLKIKSKELLSLLEPDFKWFIIYFSLTFFFP